MDWFNTLFQRKPQRCERNTRDGSRCKRKCTDMYQYCWQHKNSESFIEFIKRKKWIVRVLVGWLGSFVTVLTYLSFFYKNNPLELNFFLNCISIAGFIPFLSFVLIYTLTRNKSVFYRTILTISIPLLVGIGFYTLLFNNTVLYRTCCVPPSNQNLSPTPNFSTEANHNPDGTAEIITETPELPTQTTKPQTPMPTWVGTHNPTNQPCELKNGDLPYILPCEYNVLEGDSYFWVAEKIYDNQSLGIPIMNHNRKADGRVEHLEKGTKLILLLENDILTLPYNFCQSKCNISEFPCVFLKEKEDETWGQIANKCYGGASLSGLIETNNEYTQKVNGRSAVVIPRMAVNPLTNITLLLKELRGYLDERKPHLAYERLHSVQYIGEIESYNGNGYEELFLEGLWSYYCINPEANNIKSLSQDFTYWQAEVDIYKCKNSEWEISLKETQDGTLENWKVCIIIEGGKWKIDRWIKTVGSFCTPK